MKEEHNNVRENVGLFDVSHMGEFIVSGEDALSFLNHWTPNNVAKLKIGKAHYTNILREDGTIVDDLLIYRLKEDNFLLVVNALNIDKDFEYLNKHKYANMELVNKSDEYAQVAIQGRYAGKIIEEWLNIDVSEMTLFSFIVHDYENYSLIISRTGYTGEDGFEVYMPRDIACNVWTALLNKGKKYNICPCGLGARDSLRLEAALPLYGNDMDDTTTPVEADLAWIIKFKKGDFIAKELLKKQKKEGTQRILAGIELIDKGIPRQGYKIFIEGKESGIITSGLKSPWTGRTIAMGYIPPSYNELNREIHIEIRNKTARAKIVKKPFFERDY